MHWVPLLGYLASLMVLLTFCMSTMIPLRIAALASNILFCSYGYLNHLYPILALHAILFPVNLYRLLQFYHLVRATKTARSTDLPIESLIPYMREQHAPAAHILLRKGDTADRMYFLADGILELPELGKRLQPGAILGEIGVFSRSEKRSETVVCQTDCRLLVLTANKAKQLFFQEPAFAYSITGIIIDRLLENNEKLQAADRSPNKANTQ